MRERDIERHLVKRVRELGGVVRKVQWVGRVGAPDRLVALPAKDALTPFGARYRVAPFLAFVELKNPYTIKTFPADARERAQAREHDKMRAVGMRVEVIGTLEQVEELLR